MLLERLVLLAALLTAACGGIEPGEQEGEDIDFIVGSGPGDTPAPPPCTSVTPRSAMPDLVPYSVEQHFDGNDTEVVVRIKNQGCAIAPAMSWAFRITGAAFVSNIPLILEPDWMPTSRALQPGQIATFTHALSSASYWTIQVDYATDVHESWENNNEKTFVMPVE